MKMWAGYGLHAKVGTVEVGTAEVGTVEVGLLFDLQERGVGGSAARGHQGAECERRKRRRSSGLRQHLRQVERSLQVRLLSKGLTHEIFNGFFMCPLEGFSVTDSRRSSLM